MATRLTAQESDFVEKMGTAAQDDGLPRIAGRIWGVLSILEDPQTADSLSKLLEVSRGSISINTRLLEGFEVIERRSVPGERKEFFAIRPNPYAALVRGIARRSLEKADMAHQAGKSVKSPVVRQRLNEMADFHILLGDTFENLLDEFEPLRKKHKQKRRSVKS